MRHGVPNLLTCQVIIIQLWFLFERRNWVLLNRVKVRVSGLGLGLGLEF